eukprot:111331_1
MLPLLNNKSTNAKTEWINFTEQWDKATFVINLLRHLYVFLLISYFWDYHQYHANYGNVIMYYSIAQLILILYISLGCVISLVTWGCSIRLVDALENGMYSKGKCHFWICVSLAVILQPFSIIFMYISLVNFSTYKQIRILFYFTIFFNLLWNGLPIYLALCYYLVHHPAQYFSPNKFQQLLILIYFILYFLCILFIYPLFMPLPSINTKHLLFKLFTFAFNTIKVLFILFIFVSYRCSKISVHPFVEYIYDFYLMQFFEISTALSIWISFYIVPWHLKY